MSAKVIMSDNHCHPWKAHASYDSSGVNSRLRDTLNEIVRASHAAKKIGAKRVYGAGDLYHIRGSIPPVVINTLKATLRRCHEEYGVEFALMDGNHDLESNDSLTLGSAVLALSDMKGVTIVQGTQVFDDDKVIMVSWHDKLDDLRAELKELVKRFEESLSEWTLILHAPLNGVIAGIPDNGLSPEELAELGFNQVFVGHYHSHRVFFDGLVVSIGATTHQTFNDVGTLAGFIAIKDGKMQHIQSVAPKFVSYDIADGEFDESIVKGNFLRIRVGEVSESEILAIKERAKELGALSVIVEATPRRVIAERSEQIVNGGETLSQSVEAYIKSQDYLADKKAVAERAQAIVAQVEGLSL